MVGLAIKDLRPTRIVKEEGFWKLMEYCESRVPYYHESILVKSC